MQGDTIMIILTPQRFRELVLLGAYAYKLYRSDEEFRSCNLTELGTTVPRILRALRDLGKIASGHIEFITSKKGFEYQRALELIVEYKHNDYFLCGNRKKISGYKDMLVHEEVITSAGPLVARFDSIRIAHNLRRIYLVNTARLHCSEVGIKRAKSLLQVSYPAELVRGFFNKYADEDAHFAEKPASARAAIIQRAHERFHEKLDE